MKLETNSGDDEEYLIENEPVSKRNIGSLFFFFLQNTIGGLCTIGIGINER